MTAKKIAVEQLEKDYVEGLDQEEIAILQELEAGNYQPTSKERLETFKAIAKENITKRKAKNND